MMITVEISMYPFQENYRDLIKDFVSHLNQRTDLRISTGATSTLIVGEYSRVMNAITEMIRWSHERQGKAVFVTKFLPGYVPHQRETPDAEAITGSGLDAG